MSSSHRCVRAPGAHAIRGAALPSRLIAIAVIVLALGAGAWWFFMRPGAPPIPGVTTAPSPTATPTSPDATAAVSDELTVDQLYREARKAMNENRMAAPQGNNALEYYLKIVAKQPDDSGAKDALRELFPFATGTAEDQINQGNFDEANRVIALLAQADPSNYSLTILRSKLDAKKKLADREQAAAAAAAAAKPQAPAAAAQPTAAATAATTQPAAETPAAGTAPAAPPAATGVTPDSTASTTTPPPAAAPAPRPAAPPPPAPASAGGETHEVAVTSPPVPVYPLAAARNRQEGWVDVEFTVGPDGSVDNAHVTASQPSRVFDREAIAAVQRAKFEPKMQNGVAVASTLRRRIEFKLGK
jgi:protein TonB